MKCSLEIGARETCCTIIISKSWSVSFLLRKVIKITYLNLMSMDLWFIVYLVLFSLWFAAIIIALYIYRHVSLLSWEKHKGIKFVPFEDQTVSPTVV